MVMPLFGRLCSIHLPPQALLTLWPWPLWSRQGLAGRRGQHDTKINPNQTTMVTWLYVCLCVWLCGWPFRVWNSLQDSGQVCDGWGHGFLPHLLVWMMLLASTICLLQRVLRIPWCPPASCPQSKGLIHPMHRLLQLPCLPKVIGNGNRKPGRGENWSV